MGRSPSEIFMFDRFGRSLVAKPNRREILALSALPLMRAADTRPNIVFILMDDLRSDALGCTGHPFVRTPHIDRLAKEGATLVNAFTTTPLSLPSRASFLTGRFAHSHDVRGNGDATVMSMKMSTWPRLQQKAGYETAFFGSHTTDAINRLAVEFIRKTRTRPFSLTLAHKAVGGPATVPDRYRGLYLTEPIRRAPSIADNMAGKPAMRRKIETPADLPPMKPTADEQIRQQLRLLTAADEGVGRVFSALEETRQIDNTLIAFSSVNGYFWGEHGFTGKRAPYDEALRIPLLMRYPKLIRSGTRLRNLVVNLDLAPTMLEASGLAVPEDVRGRSLVPLLTGRAREWRRAMFCEYYEDPANPRVPSWQAARTERWKYIRYTNLEDMDEFYDLASDPYEIRNLIDDGAAQDALDDMREEMRRLWRESF